MPAFIPGRLPHDPRPARVRLRRVLGATLKPPPARDWGCPAMDYMALNDQLGCCTIASKDHMITGQQFYGQAQAATITDADTLRAYSAVSGYDPATGTNDNGATLQDSLNYWRKTGIGGYRIESFAQVDARDLDLIRTCIDAFGAVDAGMWFPDFAEQQFNAGQVWDIPARRRYRNLGGHCVPIVAYGADFFDCWTWGRRQRMSLAFFTRFVDETWAVADANWQRPDGSIPNGIDGAAANAEFKSLVGVAGPFNEAVSPPPSPLDPPGPGAPTAADALFAQACRDWLQAKGM